MHEDGQKLLNLMFLPNETVCVSNSKFGYHSIPLQNALEGPVTLVPHLDSKRPWEEQVIYCESKDLTLAALNPIEGYRRDCNVKKYRNFLVELDTGTIDEQIEYIKRYAIPYSAMIFSGSKSVHTLISLSDDIPDEKSYRKIAQWILNILSLADQNIKNPSRSIRIPGAEREPGKFQKLLDFKDKVNLKDLGTWLNNYPQSKPKEREKRKVSNTADISNVPIKCQSWLKDGFPAGMGRNQGWFQLSCEFYTAGFDEDQIIEIFQEYFVEEHDFKEKEWFTTIYSALKYMSEK